MVTFYVADEVEFFAVDCREVEANDMESAAESEAARIFDEDGVDTLRPVELIVATSREGADAHRVSVRRTVTIDDRVERSDPIDIPADEKEEA